MRRLHLITRNAPALPGGSFDYVEASVKFIFSWVVLLLVGVIVSGKMLNLRLKPQFGTGDVLNINIKMFKLKATGSEVTLGLTWYIICLLLLGLAFGRDMREFVLDHFGIDPGQFNALGFMSSLMAASISFIIFLFGGPHASASQRAKLEERNQKINRITRQNTGKDPDKLPGVDE